MAVRRSRPVQERLAGSAALLAVVRRALHSLLLDALVRFVRELALSGLDDLARVHVPGRRQRRRGRPRERGQSEERGDRRGVARGLRAHGLRQLGDDARGGRLRRDVYERDELLP